MTTTAAEPSTPSGSAAAPQRRRQITSYKSTTSSPATDRQKRTDRNGGPTAHSPFWERPTCAKKQTFPTGPFLTQLGHLSVRDQRPLAAAERPCMIPKDIG